MIGISKNQKDMDLIQFMEKKIRISGIYATSGDVT
jgi:hypothetical protein